MTVLSKAAAVKEFSVFESQAAEGRVHPQWSSDGIQQDDGPEHPGEQRRMSGVRGPGHKLSSKCPDLVPVPGQRMDQ